MLMTKRTLQELADFFGCWVAMDETTKLLYGYKNKPVIHANHFDGDLIDAVTSKRFICDLPDNWQDSLTAPSEPPFKEGELVIHKNTDGMYRWSGVYIKESYRRPTEEEWKKLHGESE